MFEALPVGTFPTICCRPPLPPLDEHEGAWEPHFLPEHFSFGISILVKSTTHCPPAFKMG